MQKVWIYLELELYLFWVNGPTQPATRQTVMVIDSCMLFKLGITYRDYYMSLNHYLDVKNFWGQQSKIGDIQTTRCKTDHIGTTELSIRNTSFPSEIGTRRDIAKG
jgi:hypothetical protein